MTVTYCVEEITPIDYSQDDARLLGEYDTLDYAIARARDYVPKPRNTIFGETYARITVQGWKA